MKTEIQIAWQWLKLLFFDILCIGVHDWKAMRKQSNFVIKVVKKAYRK